MAQYDLPQTKRVNLQAPQPTPFVGAPVVAAAPPPKTPARVSGDPRGLTAFIRETAAKYGVSPEIALKVAKSEGLAQFSGDGGKSGGAFQLYTGGGLGNNFQKETGLDPLDPANEKATIDYALKHASTHGWGPWYGAAKVGVGQFDGISGRGGDAAAAAPLDPTPNVGAGASAYNENSGTTTASTTTPDTEAKDEKKKKDKTKDAAGDALSDIGKLFSEGPVAKNAARASGPTNVAAPSLPIPMGPISMVDSKRADAQRQMLAMAMQRLNSGRLV